MADRTVVSSGQVLETVDATGSSLRVDLGGCTEFHAEQGNAAFQFGYPRLPGHITHLEVDLSDVRAADGLRISYDFERDGWKIEQAQVFQWEAADTACDPEWREVAFVQAWGSQRVPNPDA